MARQALSIPSPEDDPFYWGSRLVRAATPDGGTRLREVPLTRADVLSPEEGDMMVQGSLHWSLLISLGDRLERHFDSRDDVAVFGDMKMIWATPDLPQSAPDLSIVCGVRDKHRVRSSFVEAEEGVVPSLVIEVVSERYREIDHRDKVAIYARAGVPEYLIIDPATTPFTLTAFRRDSASGSYRESTVDPQRGWLSKTTGLWFRADPEDTDVVMEDADSGKRLLSAREEKAERRAEAAARQAEAEARHRAEAARRAEAEARHRAEAARQAEAEARHRAEQARRQAERELAELRREYEAELTRMRERLARLERDF